MTEADHLIAAAMACEREYGPDAFAELWLSVFLDFEQRHGNAVVLIDDEDDEFDLVH